MMPLSPCPFTVDITKVAERTISDDLEFLISKTVNTDKADYAGELIIGAVIAACRVWFGCAFGLQRLQQRLIACFQK